MMIRKKKKTEKKATRSRGSASLKAAVEKDMPGWTIVEKKKGGAADAQKAAHAKAKGDAVSPSLATLKQSASGKPVRDAKPVPPKGKAQFVEVQPKYGADAPGGARKVALVRDGKIVAQQG
jgi:hypothetical protein